MLNLEQVQPAYGRHDVDCMVQDSEGLSCFQTGTTPTECEVTLDDKIMN